MGYSQLRVDGADVHTTITDAPEVLALKKDMADHVTAWWTRHSGALEAIEASTKSHELIGELSESLLAGFRNRALIDEYAVYEQLMSYWHDTMHDDIALIMTEGWEGAAMPRKTIEDKDRKFTETPDLVIGSGKTAAKYKMDLIPPDLISATYFAAERETLDALSAQVDGATQAVEEFIEENSGEEGLLAEAIDDGKITKKLAAARLRDAKREGSDPDEVAALTELMNLYTAEAEIKKAAKGAAANLDAAVLSQYGKLLTDDIRHLMIAAKWGATVARDIDSELTALIQWLADRLATLAERYDATLAEIENEAATLGGKVNAHLSAMGVL